MIAAGRLKPGEELVHRKLAAELGLSIIPLGQTLRALEGKGVLEQLPNGRTRVRMWKREDILDSYALREAVEGVSARFCALRASDDEIQELRRLLEALETAIARGDHWEEEDLAFHNAIMKFGHSAVLENTFENASLVHELIARFYLFRTRSPDRVSPHAPIFEAIAARDADEAERRMRHHIREAYKAVLPSYGIQPDSPRAALSGTAPSRT